MFADVSMQSLATAPRHVMVRTNIALEEHVTTTIASRMMTVTDYLRCIVSFPRGKRKVNASHDRWRVKILGCGRLAWT